MTDTVRIGVLGCADIAVRRMLPAFTAHPGTVVTAVASRDADKARRTADRFGGAPVTGYAELLAQETVDAVYLPLPAALHADWTEAALAAGKTSPWRSPQHRTRRRWPGCATGPGGGPGPRSRT